eukprot:GHVR01023128.1.p2 GENE.GHVR01023128.1~~GHVR01023128.1.p2  ORF type:complete len:137 (+),score=15.23 GHVR01023128.1:99-509(+)
MAAAIHGRAGAVKVGASPTAVASVTSWSYEESVDEQETTAMGDVAKTFLGGLRDGSGQVDAWWSADDAGHAALLTAFAAGTAVALEVYPDGAEAGDICYNGDVVVKNVSNNSSKDDIITISFQFRGFLSKDTLPLS